MNNVQLKFALPLLHFSDMQQVRSNREPSNESITRERGIREPPLVVRTELSSLLSDYTGSQRHCMKHFWSLFFLQD